MSNGGIIYALVARGTCVLAEFTTTSGNFTTVTRRILEKIPREDAKMSYVYDSHVFHYVVAHGITYMCMADTDFGRGVPFAFLDDITRRWSTTYGERGQTALAYGMNEDFSRVLQKQMDYFSRDPNADRMARVQGEIDEVRSVMVHNIERVLERGEKIELLVDKTERLDQPAGVQVQAAEPGAQAVDVVQEREGDRAHRLRRRARRPLHHPRRLRRRLRQVPSAARAAEPEPEPAGVPRPRRAAPVTARARGYSCLCVRG